MSAPGLTTTSFAHPTDDGERVWLLGLYTYKATGDETGDAYSLFQVQGPGGLATPMHRHEHEEEGFYVVDGAVTIFADGIEHELRSGGFAFSPGAAGHEEMFREMGEPAPAAEIPAPSSASVDPALLGAIAGRHGTIITGPPPEPR